MTERSGASGSSILASSSFTSCAVISEKSRSKESSAGDRNAVMNELSSAITDRSSGTRIPSFAALESAAIASVSL